MYIRTQTYVELTEKEDEAFDTLFGLLDEIRNKVKDTEVKDEASNAILALSVFYENYVWRE